MIIISDTSVITNLAAIEHLHLLPKLYGQVMIPDTVYHELADVEPPEPGTREVQTESWFSICSATQHELVDRLQREARLDRGESEAIALALELNADLLLIDERRGRQEANRLGLKITGLLGVLIEAKQKRLISAIKPLMNSLQQTSRFRISPALYQKILEITDES
ncbi:MAG: DUF3368 domain-containing protein [Spirulina sp. SIO3F2]|nr:DUF3368 domain-containing protein [Spirulina sp. SIO3F2]